MFNMMFGTPIIINNAGVSEKDLKRMRKSLAQREKLTGGKFNLYTGDNNEDDLDESQVLLKPEFECLVEPILKHAKAYVDAATSHSDEYQQYIMKSWPVVIKTGGSVQRHTHEYAHLSAVFYFDDPEPHSGGHLTFVRPPTQPIRHIGINEQLLDQDASGLFITITPKKNGLIIFPSVIPHYVSEYVGKKPRFSVSCDLMNIKVKGPTEAALISLDKWITNN